MWLASCSFFVLASSTAIGVLCALAVPSEWAIEAALGVGIVLVFLLYSLVLTKQQNVEPRPVVMDMPPGRRRSSVSLTDCPGVLKPEEDCDVGDEQDHPASPPRESEIGDVDDEQDHPAPPPQRCRMSMPALGQVLEDSEGSPRENYRDSNERQGLSLLAPSRQDSEESWCAYNSYRSLNERTQREILRLNSIKAEETARVSNRQLYFHDTSGKWALFTLRHSKKKSKVVVLELAIQDKKTRKVKNIVFDNETGTLTDNRNAISLSSEDRGIVMKSLNLMCKVASVPLDCIN